MIVGTCCSGYSRGRTRPRSSGPAARDKINPNISFAGGIDHKVIHRPGLRAVIMATGRATSVVEIAHPHTE